MEASLRIEAVTLLRTFFVRSNEFTGLAGQEYISDVHVKDLYLEEYG